jgi:2,4-dienoyl-CoA reductase-like NADH-dependent reductase (Old Yellow Enzyme family)
MLDNPGEPQHLQVMAECRISDIAVEGAGTAFAAGRQFPHDASLIGSLSAASTPVMVIAAGEADAVAFGKAFIANPDLVRRLRDDAPLNRWDSATFYEGKDKGYTDYPPLAV